MSEQFPNINGTGSPVPTPDALQSTPPASAPDTVVPTQVVLTPQPETTAAQVPQSAAPSVASAPVSPAPAASQQPAAPVPPVSPFKPAPSAGAAPMQNNVNAQPAPSQSAFAPQTAAPASPAPQAFRPAQPNAGANPNCAPGYRQPAGQLYGYTPAGAPVYRQPYGATTNPAAGNGQIYGRTPSGAPVYRQPNGATAYAAPGYGQGPAQPQQPIDYEAVRRREQAKKALYKKVKSRYTAACTIPFIVGCFSTVMSIILSIWLAGALANTRHAAEKMTDMLEVLQQYSYAISGVVIVPVSIVVAIIFFKSTKIASLRSFFPWSPGIIAYSIFGTMIAVGMSALLNFISILLGFASDTIPAASFSSLYSYDTELPFILQVCGISYICVIGPIMEEILYRGLCLNLCSHISRVFALFVSSLMFSLMHLNLSQLIPTFILGMVLAYIALKSHSLLPTILMHIGYNSTTMLVDMVKFNARHANELGAPAGILGIITVAGIISVIIVFVKNKGIDERADGMKTANFFTPDELPILPYFRKKQITGSAFFSTWSFWGVIGLYALNLIVAVILAVAILGSIM